MTLRTVLVVLLALVSGGSAAVTVTRLRNQASGASNPDITSVVVAAAAIQRGTTITPDCLKTVDYPKNLVPAGALTKFEDALDRVAMGALVLEEPVLDGKLAPKGAGHGMAALIPKGMRAFTILTPSLAANVSGFILPGNKVDVLLTVSGTGEEANGGGTTTTLLQGVEIWAAGQRVEAPADNKVDVREMQSVTLLVTPDQAAKLDLGQNKGTLHLSLRNPQDNQAASPRRATLADLRLYQEKPWDERARVLLEVMGKVLAQRATKQEPSKPSPQPAAENRPTVMIRTLRGSQDGAVLLQAPGSASGDR